MTNTSTCPLVRPAWITFTGIDEHTDLNAVRRLSQSYPIEWGFLFSPHRQGEGRYPPLQSIWRAVDELQGLRLAAHLCGADAREVLETGRSSLRLFTHRSASFGRVQINTSDPRAHQPAMQGNVAAFADLMRAEPILQMRTLEFPQHPRIRYLFDCSGGRGQRTTVWPVPAQALCGYAGGIGPDNARAVIEQISTLYADCDVAGATGHDGYWIDMESRVRDSRDRLCLDLCEAVCQAVFAGGTCSHPLPRSASQVAAEVTQ